MGLAFPMVITGACRHLPNRRSKPGAAHNPDHLQDLAPPPQSIAGSEGFIISVILDLEQRPSCNQPQPACQEQWPDNEVDSYKLG